jgi:glycosyltransferase involved in cell wall biosynthesis
MSDSLSVVMPVYNEATSLPTTMASLIEAVAPSEFEVELVVVDDGSTDGSAEIAEEALAGRLPLRVVRQENGGRFEARRAGLEVATGEWVLLLDGRVRLRPRSLEWVHGRLLAGEQVWNGHVYVDAGSNPFGAFSNVLVELAWREYFDDPRTTSFGPDGFDLYPKGTTCFLAPRDVLLRGAGEFRSFYADSRFGNDDTPLIRWIASRQRIHLSPSFSCDYTPRSSLGSFLRHSFHRGMVFVDGHGRSESRYYPVVLAFFPVSAGLAGLVLRRPLLLPLLTATVGAVGAAVAVRTGRTRFEARSFAALLPVYAVAHGAGMWRGLAMMILRRLGRSGRV